MTETGSQLYRVTMPSRIRALPRTRAGYPIPFFAAIVDGKPDLRIADEKIVYRCVNERLCWICGQRRSKINQAFVGGPLMAVNRICGEAPSHLVCAEYAAQVCPYLVRPTMERRDRGKPEATVYSGHSIKDNPGMTLVWSANGYRIVRDGKRILFNIGDTPTTVSWWTEGRPATRAEVVALLEERFPLLQAEAAGDSAALKLLDRQLAAAMAHVPSV